MPRDNYKVISRVNRTLTNTVTDITLHTADVGKTLTRIIIQGFAYSLAAGHVYYTQRLAVLPNGYTLPGMSFTESLDQDVPDEIIMEHLYACAPPGSGNFITPINIDSKGMRILDQTDTLVLQGLASAVDDLSLELIVTMFFKDR